MEIYSSFFLVRRPGVKTKTIGSLKSIRLYILRIIQNIEFESTVSGVPNRALSLPSENLKGALPHYSCVSWFCVIFKWSCFCSVHLFLWHIYYSKNDGPSQAISTNQLMFNRFRGNFGPIFISSLNNLLQVVPCVSFTRISIWLSELLLNELWWLT